MICEMPLNYKSSNQYFALIDEADIDRVLIYGPWRLQIVNPDSFYIYRSKDERGPFTLLHRFIMKVTDPKVLVEFIDKNSFNNSKENLRKITCTNSSLNRNRISRNNKSGVTGLTWQEAPPRWHANVKYKGQNIYLGAFVKKEKAVKVRKEAVEILIKIQTENLEFKQALKLIEIAKKVAKIVPGKRNRKKVKSGKKIENVLSLTNLISS